MGLMSRGSRTFDEASLLAEAATTRSPVLLIAFSAIAVFALLDAVFDRLVRWAVPRAGHEARVRVRGCLVSVVHDVWAMATTVYLPVVIVNPEGSPPAAGPFGLALHSHVPFAAMDAAGGVLGGFLFYDLVHYIAHRAIYTKDLATQLLHHGVLFGMLWLNRNTLWFNYAFPVMYAGELSTLFLNVRLVYRALGATEQWASIAFAAAFFSTRVLLFGLLVAHLVLNADALRALLSPPLRVSYLGLLPLLYALNLFWWGQICKAIARILSKENQARKDGDKED
jgi:hypothetical protein